MLSTSGVSDRVGSLSRKSMPYDIVWGHSRRCLPIRVAVAVVTMIIISTSA